MFVHIHVLEVRGSIEALGAAAADHIVARVVLPSLPLTKKSLPDRTIPAPVVGQSIGFAIPPEVAEAMKNKLAKRSDPRNRFLLELEVVCHDRSVVTGTVRLLCLAHGFVVERWIYVRRHEGAPVIGEMKLRLVMRATEEQVQTILSLPEHDVEPNDLSRTGGLQL